jgi:putative protease
MAHPLHRNDVEIMAPAGDFESLMAAIQGGADAVYFGLGPLNMRSGSAKNFREEDLADVCTICQRHGIRAYLTLNIVVYDHELEEVKRNIGLARQAGVDAIIASDHAVIQYAIETGMPVHISTQANISNIAAVRYYAKYADVLVLARELSLEQMHFICQRIREEGIRGPSGEIVRVEVFIHGALCMAISGKCYLSLHQSNKSANRGLCRQECRKAYEVTEMESGKTLRIENEYIMSPKDLATISFIDRILIAGVRVLKIEGRGRSPEYVKTVTQCYHEAVNSVLQGTYDTEKVSVWEQRLSSVFNRGFWDGYYLGRRLGEWSEQYGSHATTRKVYLGKGTNYFQKVGVGEFLIETKALNIGDSILITGPTTGVMETTVKEIRVDDKSVTSAEKGAYCSLPLPGRIRRSDKLYEIVPASDTV